MNVFACASPVQIVRAIQMKFFMEYFAGDADMFVVNIFKGADKIVNNLRSINLFHEVGLIEPSEFEHSLFAMVYNRKILQLIKQRAYKKLIAFNLGGNHIDVIYNTNVGDPDFEYHCVEDGPNIYKIPKYADYKIFHPYRILGLQHAHFHISSWWTSCPEFVDVPDCYHTEKRYLPPIDLSDDELVGLINRAFDYRDNKSLMNADVLIMDESHYQDDLMKDDADYRLYMEVMGRYPKARFLMKMHPRTKYNRYLGKVEIMDSRDIPWEVYAMNRARCGAKDLIQMSITCGTMLSDKLMFNHEGTKIFTAPLFYDKIRRGNDDAPRVCPENTDTIRRFKETYKNPERFIITDTREELYGALDKRLLGR